MGLKYDVTLSRNAPLHNQPLCLHHHNLPHDKTVIEEQEKDDIKKYVTGFVTTGKERPKHSVTRQTVSLSSANNPKGQKSSQPKTDFCLN